MHVYNPISPSATTAPVNGQAEKQRRRALRKLLRDLVAFTGTAINDLAATPRKAPQRNRRRLLYRRADTLTDNEVKSIVVELGPERVLRVVDRLTSPELPFVVAAE